MSGMGRTPAAAVGRYAARGGTRSRRTYMPQGHQRKRAKQDRRASECDRQVRYQCDRQRRERAMSEEQMLSDKSSCTDKLFASMQLNSELSSRLRKRGH